MLECPKFNPHKMEMVINSKYAYFESVALCSVAISADQCCWKNGSCTTSLLFKLKSILWGFHIVVLVGHLHNDVI